jgi:deoxyadenosine/deoxycytidine kinase
MIHTWTQAREQLPLVVVVAGNIGVGKTTLTRMLAQELQCSVLGEPWEGNPYLSDFYENMHAWAFHSQLYFLVYRARIYHTLLRQERRMIIMDRSIYEDADIFACNLHQMGYISHRDYHTYRDTYCILCDLLPSPDLVIYLHASVTTLKQRIAKRGRQMELTLPTSYLARLNDLYEDWAAHFDLSKLLDINVDGIDFEHDPIDRRAVMKQIFLKLGLLTQYRLVHMSDFATLLA